MQRVTYLHSDDCYVVFLAGEAVGALHADEAAAYDDNLLGTVAQTSHNLLCVLETSK